MKNKDYNKMWHELKNELNDKINDTCELIKEHEKEYHLKHSRLKHGAELSILTWIKLKMIDLEGIGENDER